MSKKKSIPRRTTPLKRKAGKQPPLELLIFAASDSTSRDPNSGKLTLYGMFDKIVSAGFPAQANFSLYAKVKGRGEYHVAFEMVTPNGKVINIGEADIKCSKEGLAVMCIGLAGVPFTRTGNYKIRLKSAGKPIGNPIIIQSVKQPEKKP